MIKEARWSGWVWVGESSFWYRPTRVVPDQRPLNGRCCCCCCFPRLPYSAITTPFQSPFVATIPPYFILGSLHFLSSPPHLPFPSLPVPPEYAYNMPILLHCIQQYRLCYPWRRLWRNVRPTSKSRAVVLQLFSADDDDFLDFSHPITGRRNSNTTRWQHAFSDIDTLFHMLRWMLLRDV